MKVTRNSPRQALRQAAAAASAVAYQAGGITTAKMVFAPQVK